jgi:hypothetical protein
MGTFPNSKISPFHHSKTRRKFLPKAQNFHPARKRYVGEENEGKKLRGSLGGGNWEAPEIQKGEEATLSAIG